MSVIEQAVRALLMVEWEYRWERFASYRLLFMEYLRRQAMWMDILKPAEQAIFPFADWAWQFDETLAVDRQLRDMLFEHLRPTNSTFLRGLLLLAVKWNAVKDWPDVTALGLLDPYDPLLYFYRRGGTLYYNAEWKFFELNRRMPLLPRGNARFWLRAEPYVELDMAALDRIDQQAASHSSSMSYWDNNPASK